MKIELDLSEMELLFLNRLLYSQLYDRMAGRSRLIRVNHASFDDDLKAERLALLDAEIRALTRLCELVSDQLALKDLR